MKVLEKKISEDMQELKMKLEKSLEYQNFSQTERRKFRFYLF